MAAQVYVSEGHLMSEGERLDLDGLVEAQSAITAASEAHALNAAFSDTEVEAALNALGAKVNAIITALESAGVLVAN